MKNLPVAAEIAIALAGLIALSAAAYGLALKVAEPSSKEPSQVLCAVFDLSTPSRSGEWSGWHPLSDQHRSAVKELMLKGKVEILEADSIECIERHEKNKRFGDVIETRRMEWWRLVPRGAKERSGHGALAPEKAPVSVPGYKWSA